MKFILFLFIATCSLLQISFGQKNKSPVTRKITTNNNNETAVDITVYGSSLSNKTMKAAKIMEAIPEGCSCNVSEDAGSIVSILNDHLKMLWFDLPVIDFHVKYVLTCKSSIDVNSFSGEFSYVENDETVKKLVIENSN